MEKKVKICKTKQKEKNNEKNNEKFKIFNTFYEIIYIYI